MDLMSDHDKELNELFPHAEEQVYDVVKGEVAYLYQQFTENPQDFFGWLGGYEDVPYEDHRAWLNDLIAKATAQILYNLNK